MKRFVIICGIAVAVATLFYLTREEWFSFITIGKVPFTSIALPAIVMMSFWMVIVPACIIWAKSISIAFWSGIEILGRFDQRRINRQFRLAARTRHTTTQQVSLAMVATWLAVTQRYLIQADDTTKADDQSTARLAVATN